MDEPVQQDHQRVVNIARLRTQRLRNTQGLRNQVNGFGPLQMPVINPFLCWFNKDTEKEWSEDDWENAMRCATFMENQNRARDTEDDLHILHFADTHLKTLHLLGRHADDEWNRVADGYIFRYGYLNDSRIHSVIAESPTMNTSNFGWHRWHFSKYSSSAQCQTMTFLKQVSVVYPSCIGARAD